MANIFLSYRREDAAGWTGRLAADLRRAFPGSDVFQDIASIEIGEDFVEAMRRSLSSCAVMLVVIGPRWLAAADESGKRRLDDVEDLVRLEVVEGLQRAGLRVVPVLVGTAIMPKASELPEPLKPLARRHAHEITDRRWDFDVSQLVAALRKIPALAEPNQSAESAPPHSSRAGAPAPAPAVAPAATPPPTRTRPSRPPDGEWEFRDGEWVEVNPRKAELAPGTVFRDAPEAPEMVVVPAGSFEMGSAEGEGDPDEHPRHRVAIARAFAVGRYEVTFEEWDACVVAGGCTHRPSDKGWGRGRRPAIDVSWTDAQAYLGWLSEKTGQCYRLLSEAEWEYATRAGTSTRYPWGDEAGGNHANFDGSGYRR